ncbi:MAG: hypothetical protein IV100_00240 [Myxococcales bacterium]|nr:hypothetical protein [Myxococcales bacterium]
MTNRTLALSLALVAACGGGRSDDCPTTSSGAIVVYPADGEVVGTGTWVHVIGADDVRLMPASGSTAPEPTTTTRTFITPNGPVVELEPWFSLDSDAEYEVWVQGEVISRFRTASSGDTPSSDSAGPPLVRALGGPEVPCCGNTCKGGGVVELPWEGPPVRELVLVDVLEQVNGVCGATTRHVTTLAFDWPGDDDERLVSGLAEPLTGCYVLRVHESVGRTGRDLGPVCVDEATFTPQPPSDAEACRPSDGCTAAAGRLGVPHSALTALALLSLALQLHWRRQRRRSESLDSSLPAPRKEPRTCREK